MALLENEDRRILLKLSADAFTVDNSDPAMVDINSTYFRHPEQGLITEGGASLNVAPEDEVVVDTKFSIDKAGRESNVITVVSIKAKIKAKNIVTGDEFDLETFSLPFAEQYINLTIARPFHIPATEIRKNIVVQRRTDLDTGQKIFYSLNFPFKMRWETWVALPGANAVFFVSSEQNNGLNHYWHKYSLQANWKLYYEFEVITFKDSLQLSYKKTLNINSYTYAANTVYDAKSIKSYDGATELTVSGKKYLLGYKDTTIVASFKHADNSPFSLSNCVVNILIEVFESGGIEGQRRMSSLWASDSDTWFKSTDSSNKTVLSLATTTGVNDTLNATLKVGYNLIPAASKFKITARLYELNTYPYDGNGLQTDDGIDIINADGEHLIID